MVYLSLGANLGDRERQLHLALTEIERRVGRVVHRSDLFTTQPWGFQSEHPFLNACAAVDTSLPPPDLLAATQDIERDLGRTTKRRPTGPYTDRLIDIDILLYDDLRIDLPDLQIPHPRIAERRFVLEPLAQIAPQVVIPPTGRTASQLLAQWPAD